MARHGEGVIGVRRRNARGWESCVAPRSPVRRAPQAPALPIAASRHGRRRVPVVWVGARSAG
eukprot:scaffold76592_cov22-Phaeocystis_antarctica.AAC.1